MEKVVIVGANHAGTAATNTILSSSKEHEVIVFDRNSNISYLGCGTALWIGNQISEPDGLFYSSKEILESKGAKVHMETSVTNIDFESKTIYAGNSNGDKIVQTYDKLILATGSLPIIPNIKGTDLENVHVVKLFQDAQLLKSKLENPDINDIAIVGAGYIGVELAEAFKRCGKNVNLIDIAKCCLPAYYDEPFTELMNENLSQHGINLIFGEIVQGIEGDNKVERIVTDKNTYKADMVVLAIGFTPNTALGMDHLKTFKNGAYLVDKYQTTSIKDVYAVGDCAAVFDNSIGDMNYIALATNAVRSAIVAANNAIGNHVESIGVQGSNGISIYDLKMVSTGITYQRAIALGLDVSVADYEDFQKPEFFEKGNYKVKIRIVYDTKTRIIVGAQMASKYDMSMGIHMFSLAIQEKVTIDKISLTDIFFLPHFNKPYNYITMAALSAD